jgi:rhodanese-related sulfurtransferase
MKGFPKTINTAQDVENCFALVKRGELAAAELQDALKGIEERGFLHCPIVSVSGDGKQATIRYCNEAAAGAAGNAVIISVRHEAEPDAPGMDGDAPSLTVLTLESPLPADETVIKIPASDPYADMGITAVRINEIKEALDNE